MHSEITPEALRGILHCHILGRHCHCLSEITSTNDVARSLALQGAPEGTLVLAESQTAGRGRLARRWLAAPGRCLLMSILLRPGISPSAAFGLTILAATATARSVEAVTGLHCGIKWPNDVQVGGRKLAGVLCEMSATGDTVEWAIVGIGLNVNLDPSEYPDIASSATSVSQELGRSFPRLLLLARILEELEADYRRFLARGLAPLHTEWKRRLVTLGQQVSVEEGARSGLAEDVDEMGALLLRQADGSLLRVTAGDAVQNPAGPLG